MAGVRHEVDAHALDAPGFGEIAQAHHGGGLEAFDLHRRDMGLEPAFHRQALDPDGLLGLAAAENAGDGVEHVGRAKTAGKRFIQPNRGRETLRRRVYRDDMRFGVDDENRLRKRIDHRRQESHRLIAPSALLNQ